MRGCTCLVGNACVCPASVLSAHAQSSKDLSVTDRSRSGSRLRVDVIAPGSTIVNVTDDSEGEGDARRKRGKEREAQPRIGRRRQIIGLLVLQLGIMIHSIVIGLTLAITTGADFSKSVTVNFNSTSPSLTFHLASLTTAVVFHQLFEGLSLGIRIAALLPPLSDSDEESLSAGGFKSESNAKQNLFRRVITKIRGERNGGWLKSVLAILFAITTPTGMGLGMIVFKVGVKKEGVALGEFSQLQY